MFDTVRDTCDTRQLGCIFEIFRSLLYTIAEPITQNQSGICVEYDLLCSLAPPAHIAHKACVAFMKWTCKSGSPLGLMLLVAAMATAYNKYAPGTMVSHLLKAITAVLGLLIPVNLNIFNPVAGVAWILAFLWVWHRMVSVQASPTPRPSQGQTYVQGHLPPGERHHFNAPVNYGYTPVNYGNAPMNYGYTPVNYGGSPVNYGNAPVNYGNTPVNYGNTPVNYGNAPVNYGNTPPQQPQQPKQQPQPQKAQQTQQTPYNLRSSSTR